MRSSKDVVEVEGFKRRESRSLKRAPTKWFLLLSPPFKKLEYRKYRLGENLGMRYLASFLETHGHRVDILEPSLDGSSTEKTAKKILKNDYDLIGLSVPHGGLFPNMVKVVRILRNNGFKGHITAGGHFPTFEHKEVLRYNRIIDSIVRHEGEHTLLELVTRLDSGSFENIPGLSYRTEDSITTNSHRPLIKDLDGLPFPKRDKYSEYDELNHFAMITSRGCYGNCSFCSVRAFYGYDRPLWRYRTPENIIEEIEYLAETYDAQVISFVDDNFIGPGEFGRKRALKIAHKIAERGIEIFFEISCKPDSVDERLFKNLKEAGLRHVSIGVESGIEDILKRFNKGLTVSKNVSAIQTMRDLSLSFTPYFIMFDPHTRIEELKENVQFLYDNNICTYFTIRNALSIYRGTPLYSQVENVLKRKNWEYLYKFGDSNVTKVYRIITALGELITLDSILEVLVYVADVENDMLDRDTAVNVLEEITKRINKYVYDTVLNIIDRVSSSSEDDLMCHIEYFQKDVHTFIEYIRRFMSKNELSHVFQMA